MTQKPIYLAIFTNNIWSYLLWSPVVDVADNVRCQNKYVSAPADLSVNHELINRDPSDLI